MALYNGSQIIYTVQSSVMHQDPEIFRGNKRMNEFIRNRYQFGLFSCSITVINVRIDLYFRHYIRSLKPRNT